MITIAAFGFCMIGMSYFSGQGDSTRHAITRTSLLSSRLRGSPTTATASGAQSSVRELSGDIASNAASPLHAGYKVGNINNVVSIRHKNGVTNKEEESHQGDRAETEEDFDLSEADQIIRDELVDALAVSI